MSQDIVQATQGQPLSRARRFGIAATLAGCLSLAGGTAVVSIVSSEAVEAHGVVGLERGSRGPAVRDVQVALMNHGIAVDGGADGVYGAVTENAVKAFQKRNKLSQSGSVDEATARALGLDASPASAPSGMVGLTPGMKGADVRLLQHALIRSGWSLTLGPDGWPDGVFGSETEAALRDFQRARGLSVTGTVDQATANALGFAEQWGDDGDLSQGSSGAKVREVQEAIVRDGIFLMGGPDGYFGPGTTSAVKKYQLVNDLPVTGVVDSATAKVMRVELSGPAQESGGTVPPSESQASDEQPNDASETGGGERGGIQYVEATQVVGLELGHRGQPVRRLQRALRAAGITVVGGVDGLFGPETRAALEQFQSKYGFTVTGSLNRDTARALGLVRSPSDEAPSSPAPAPDEPADEIAEEPPAEPVYSHPYGGLKLGSSGAKVRELQEALMETGLVLFGGADGYFGPATESTLKRYQEINGLNVSGIVDDATAELMKLGTRPPSGGSGGNGGSGGGSPSAPARVSIDVFPVERPCWYTNTWHAPRGGGRVHLGVDVIAAKGQKIYAVTDGTITRVYHDRPGSLAGNGLRLTRSGGSGTYFFYAHLDTFGPGIKEGTKVKAGDVIGTVGNTGNSATPHLHFEVHPNGGDAVDPHPIVDAAGGC